MNLCKISPFKQKFSILSKNLRIKQLFKSMTEYKFHRNFYNSTKCKAIRTFITLYKYFSKYTFDFKGKYLFYRKHSVF